MPIILIIFLWFQPIAIDEKQIIGTWKVSSVEINLDANPYFIESLKAHSLEMEYVFQSEGIFIKINHLAAKSDTLYWSFDPNTNLLRTSSNLTTWWNTYKIISIGDSQMEINQDFGDKGNIKKILYKL